MLQENVLLKEIPTQVFSCEYCEIFKVGAALCNIHLYTFIHILCVGTTLMIISLIKIYFIYLSLTKFNGPLSGLK